MLSMDFLNKIKSYFSRGKRAPSFHEQVQKEKKQKYLFRPDAEEMHTYNRGKKHGIFRSKFSKKKTESTHFSDFFQKPLNLINGERDLRYMMSAVGAFLLLLVTYIIVFSPYFKISPNKILIEPLSQGIDVNTVYRSIESIYGQSIFFFDQKAIAKSIKENLKNTEYIQIDRLFPNGVKILIRSLPITVDATIYGVENKRFGVSSNGVLIPLSDIKDENFTHHLALISKELQSELFLGYKKVLSDKTMFLIGKIFELFAAEWSDLRIARANYFLIENELHIALESNSKIILAFEAEYENNTKEFSNSLLGQLVTLQTYINEHRNKLADGSITYLDVRIPGKIFSCADEARCRQNLIMIYGGIYE